MRDGEREGLRTRERERTRDRERGSSSSSDVIILRLVHSLDWKLFVEIFRQFNFYSAFLY